MKLAPVGVLARIAEVSARLSGGRGLKLAPVGVLARIAEAFPPVFLAGVD